MVDYLENIKIEGRYGTWYEIDRCKCTNGKEFVLFESEQYGGDTAAILMEMPRDKDLKKVVGKKSGKEYYQIPEDLEIEETFDDIKTAVEEDLGYEVIEETKDSLEEDFDEEVEDARSTILNGFDRLTEIYDDYPYVKREYFENFGGDAVYVIVLDDKLQDEHYKGTLDFFNNLFRDTKLNLKVDIYGGEKQPKIKFRADKTKDILRREYRDDIELQVDDASFNGKSGEDDSYVIIPLEDDLYIRLYGPEESDLVIDWEDGDYKTSLKPEDLKYQFESIEAEDEVNEDEVKKKLLLGNFEMKELIKKAKQVAYNKFLNLFFDYIANAN